RVIDGATPAGRFRRRARPKGRPPRTGGGRETADAVADRQLVAGSLPDTAGHRRRQPGLVGGRRAARVGSRRAGADRAGVGRRGGLTKARTWSGSASSIAAAYNQLLQSWRSIFDPGPAPSKAAASAASWVGATRPAHAFPSLLSAGERQPR